MWLAGTLFILIGLGLRGVPSAALLMLGAGLILLQLASTFAALGWL